MYFCCQQLNFLCYFHQKWSELRNIYFPAASQLIWASYPFKPASGLSLERQFGSSKRFLFPGKASYSTSTDKKSFIFLSASRNRFRFGHCVTKNMWVWTSAGFLIDTFMQKYGKCTLEIAFVASLGFRTCHYRMQVF